MTSSPRPQILIVDDDDAIRHVQRRLLIHGGYDVADVRGAAPALAMIKAGLRPDLVIADLEMPGFPGEAMVQRIRSARPGQKVLYVTGHIHRVLAIPPDMRAGDLFLDKPFTAKGLLDAVAQALAAVDEPETRTSGLPGGQAPGVQADRPIKILLVDEGDSGPALRMVLPTAQFVLTEVEPAGAMRAVQRDVPDLLMLSTRRLRPVIIEQCRQLKQATKRAVPILLLTGDIDRRERLRASEAGADDFVTEPVDPVELLARVRTLAKVKRGAEETLAFEQSLINFALAVEARDPSTEGHCQRLAQYAAALGTKMQLSAEDLKALERGAYLHDLGKLVIADAVLLKAGPLSRAEFTAMQTHPIAGEQLCPDVPSLTRVRSIIRHHHERFDGSGYPDKLKGDDIPLLAEIIGLVDTYDAITTNRSYQAAMSPDRAAALLIEQVEHGWRRPELVQTFLEVLPASARVDRSRRVG